MISRHPILTAEDQHYPDPQLPGGGTAPERIVAAYWTGFSRSGMPTECSDETVLAQVNHGRWLVPCPWCMSAQNASRTDPRFFCAECSNQGKGWASVIFPEDADAIETLLGMRPDKRTRNWLPGEPTSRLLAENEAHEVR